MEDKQMHKLHMWGAQDRSCGAVECLHSRLQNLEILQRSRKTTNVTNQASSTSIKTYE